VPTTAIAREGVFGSRIVAGVAYVALPIPSLVSMEVIEALRPALGQRSNIAVMGVKAVVDVAVKAVRAVKPGAGPDEQPADKPVGSIVAIGCAIIRRIVEVPVRAHGSRSNVYANGDLGVRHGCTAEKGDCESGESECADLEHDFSLIDYDSSDEQ